MAGRTVLVTGGAGLLAKSLALLSSLERPVVALPRAVLDISDRRSVGEAIDRYDPAVVLNAAAMTDVDGCERDPDAARLANVVGPANVAEACVARGIGLIHVSTDFVFDGRKTEPYTIDDEPNPLSVYGRTKLEGEEAIRVAHERAIVARTSWVFGPGGKNFASRLFEIAAASGTIRGITNMRSLPTYAPDLAGRLLELIAMGVHGTFHVTGSGPVATWFDVARTALDLAGMTTIEVVPVTVSELGLSAPRPAYSAMRCMQSERLGLAPLRDWREAMSEFARTR